MFELLQDAFSAIQAEAAAYPEGVRLWMKVMSMSFLSSLIFVIWKPSARWVFSLFLVTLAGLVIGKALMPELSRGVIGTFIHIIYWPVVLYAIWRPNARKARQLESGKTVSRVYGGWLIWITGIIVVSLALDLRHLAQIIVS